jgi:hypothetical protein
VFTGVIAARIRDGQVASRPLRRGRRDAGRREGPKFWMAVLTDILNRGVRDMFFLSAAG